MYKNGALKVLVIKDIHNNTDQERQQAHSAKHRKLLSELWKQKNKLEAMDKQIHYETSIQGTPSGKNQVSLE